MPGSGEGSSPGLILLLSAYTIDTGGFVCFCLLSQTRSSLDASTELTVRVGHKVDSIKCLLGGSLDGRMTGWMDRCVDG